MTNTPVGFVLASAGATLLLLFLVLTTPTPRSASTLARAIMILGITLGVGALAATLLMTSGIRAPTGAFLLVFRVLVYRGWVVIGTAMATVLLLVAHSLPLARSGVDSKPGRAFVTSPFVPTGLAISVALSFIATEIGKLAHDADMRTFFTQSGLPVWLMYAVMGAETIGAVGLAIPRTRLPAATGLTLIMVTAIGTHARNGDPLSDSLEAIHLLVTLVCLALIVVLRQRDTLSENALVSAHPSTTI